MSARRLKHNLRVLITLVLCLALIVPMPLPTYAAGNRADTEAGVCKDCERKGAATAQVEDLSRHAETALPGARCEADPRPAGLIMAQFQCYGNVVKGVASSLIDLVKGIGYLVKSAFTFLKNKFFSSKKVQQTDNTMSKVLRFLQKLPRRTFLSIIKDVGGWLAKLGKAFAENIYTTAKNAATCEKWSGIPLASTCVKPGGEWACLSTNQKTQVICSLVGSLGSDLVLMFVGGVGVAKLAGKGGRLASVLKSVGRTARVATASKVPKAVARAGQMARRATDRAVTVSGKTVGRAMGAVDKVPGVKQWSQLNEKAFMAGVKVGTRGGSSGVGTTGSFGASTVTAEQAIRTARTDRRVRIPRTNQKKFVSQNSTRTIVPAAENERYIQKMKNPEAGGRTFVFRDVNKKANNTNVGFDRSTAITTSYVDRVNTKIEALTKRYGDRIEITRYEGSNRLEVRIDPKKGTQLPADIESEMAKIFTTSTAEQHLFLKNNKLVRAGDEPVEWMKYGSGPDAHTANLTVRSNREFGGQLATHAWESQMTQAQLETVFNRARKVHESVQTRYEKTNLFDAKTGRLRPKIADLISKSDSPQELLDKLKPYHNISGEDRVERAQELMEYVDYARTFGAESYGARTPLALKTDDTVCFGSDLCGQNGRNLAINTAIFDEDFKNVVASSIHAEASSTKQFREMLDEAVNRRQDVLTDAGYSVETVVSGDDISTAVRTADGKPLEELDQVTLYRLSTCTDGVACLRDTYVPAKVTTVVRGRKAVRDKQEIIDVTHQLEKELRAELGKTTSEFDGRNFSIQVQKDGTMTLDMSHPWDLPMDRAADLRDQFDVAEQAFKKLVREKNPDDILGLHVRARPELPVDSDLAKVKKDKYAPIRRVEQVKASEVARRTEAEAESLRKKGVEFQEMEGETYLRSNSLAGVTRVTRDRAAGESVTYGKILKVDKLPPARAKGTGFTKALEHPQMAAYQKKLEEMGQSLVVDTSIQHTGAGAYYLSGSNRVAIQANTPWYQFLHEFQHAQFAGDIGPLFRKMKTKGMQSLTASEKAAIGDARFARLQRLMAKDLPKNAVNETLSVDAELKALGFYRFVPGFGSSSRRYALRHQITDLSKLSRLSPAQKATLRQAKREYAALLLYERGSNGAILTGGGAAIYGVGRAIVNHGHAVGRSQHNQAQQPVVPSEVPAPEDDPYTYQQIIYDKDGHVFAQQPNGLWLYKH